MMVSAKILLDSLNASVLRVLQDTIASSVMSATLLSAQKVIPVSILCWKRVAISALTAFGLIYLSCSKLLFFALSSHMKNAHWTSTIWIY